MSEATCPNRLNALRSFGVPVVLVAAVGDPEGARTVTSIIALLVAMGLALVMVAVWLHRTTRPDPELLAPLEVMGERRWRRGDPVWQRRRLDEVRPRGASPLQPSIAPPDIDEAFDDGPTASGFDDLHAARLQPIGESADDADVQPAEESADDTHAQPADDSAVDPSYGHRRPADLDTPVHPQRPLLEELPDGDIEPELLASAAAELEAELGQEHR
jgi:hypothetical protein